MSPEARARQTIDALLTAAGWHVCDVASANIRAATGVAIREFPLNAGHGFADYLLYVNGKACGVIEAKKEGATLSGVEVQSARYAQGLPNVFPALLAIACSAGEGSNFFKSKIWTAAGQPDVSGADIQSTSMRVPSVEEQEAIVAESDRPLFVLRKFEAEMNANVHRALTLRQAILTKIQGGNSDQANTVLSG